MEVIKRNPDYVDLYEENRGGFNFENCNRNAALLQKLEGTRFPQAKKTGTTICGLVVKDGVVLGADTRATAGSIVADKNADKLHNIADNIQCAGAGTSADLGATTEMMERNMEMHKLNTGTEVRVCTVVTRLKNMLFRYQGHIGCALVLGGVDISGPKLYQIYPHGSTDSLPYTTMGSGSLAAMAMMETQYKDDMTVEEGKELVANCIRAGIMNDLGSGGNVDVCAIWRDPKSGEVKKEHTRAYDSPCPRTYKADLPSFPKGVTPLLGNPEITITAGDADGDVQMGEL